MATITLSRPLLPHKASSTIAPLAQTISLDDISPQQSAPPVPNKHLPACPTGPPRPTDHDVSVAPPKTQPRTQQRSLLWPPEGFKKFEDGSLLIYDIAPSQVAQAVEFASRQPLPEPHLMFPWLHGLHPHNHIQQAYFTARRRAFRKLPTCLRAVTLVKADGDIDVARLKGAIGPEEILQRGSEITFVDPDPRDGFSIRNFHIQPAKISLLSDIIVYGENAHLTRQIAWEIAAARRHWREGQLAQGSFPPVYNTFVCESAFEEFERNHPEIVAIDAAGCCTGNVIDFVVQERKEMWEMTKASEISHNVFLGPTPELGSSEEKDFDILIECSDMGRLNPRALAAVAKSTEKEVKQKFHDFPSSGSILPPTWSHTEADGILETCKWIYHLAHGTCPAPDSPTTLIEEDTQMSFESDDEITSPPRRILIHCADGYTESTMLGIAYSSYSTGRPVLDAWLKLHTKQQRNFFAYPTDVALLTALAPRLLRESPACDDKSLETITNLIRDEPSWLPGLDGSFPSRVLDYLYLGNLGHANNPDLLKELGIGQVLSVGETAIWRDGDMEKWGEDNVLVIQGVQDNGIDPLTEDITRCLEYIDRGRQNGVATLVHCRVGVSRSATVCIAEVMRTMKLSFPRAYCYVRARRLNVIIQPHLRFAYELLKWEEALQQNGDPGTPVKRELEWGEIAREIALMNRPYSR
ncbi:Dual specificity phosphatase [Paramyrothecium foliicola]|nr:Dual specificity phosphatase [Paramyrothecium foliicola]